MKQANKDNFKELVKENLVLVDFYATWCGPCSKQSEELERLYNSRADIACDIVKVNVDDNEELANEYEGKVLIVKCDAEENMELTSKFGIRNLPTLLFIRNNEAVDRLVGAVPTNMITDKIESYQ